jgi:thioredoxin 1
MIFLDDLRPSTYSPVPCDRHGYEIPVQVNADQTQHNINNNSDVHKKSIDRDHPNKIMEEQQLLAECVGDSCTIRPKANEEDAVANTEEDQPVVDNQEARRSKKPKAPASSKFLKALHTQQELDKLISQNDAVIVEFKTSWCGACKAIEPLLEELAEVHTESVGVAVVMCDKNKETKKLATAHNVSSYPVFVLFQNGAVDGRWNGADDGKLEKAFERLSGGGGGRGGGGKKKGKGGKRR